MKQLKVKRNGLVISYSAIGDNKSIFGSGGTNDDLYAIRNNNVINSPGIVEYNSVANLSIANNSSSQSVALGNVQYKDKSTTLYSLSSDSDPDKAYETEKKMYDLSLQDKGELVQALTDSAKLLAKGVMDIYGKGNNSDSSDNDNDDDSEDSEEEAYGGSVNKFEDTGAIKNPNIYGWNKLVDNWFPDLSKKGTNNAKLLNISHSNDDGIYDINSKPNAKPKGVYEPNGKIMPTNKQEKLYDAPNMNFYANDNNYDLYNLFQKEDDYKFKPFEYKYPQFLFPYTPKPTSKTLLQTGFLYDKSKSMSLNIIEYSKTLKTPELLYVDLNYKKMQDLDTKLNKTIDITGDGKHTITIGDKLSDDEAKKLASLAFNNKTTFSDNTPEKYTNPPKDKKHDSEEEDGDRTTSKERTLKILSGLQAFSAAVAPAMAIGSAYLKNLEAKKKPSVLASIGAVGLNSIFSNRNNSLIYKGAEGGKKFADAGSVVNAVSTAGTLAGNAIQSALLDVSPKAVSAGLGETSKQVAGTLMQSGSGSYDNILNDMDKFSPTGHLGMTNAKSFNNDTTGSKALNVGSSMLSGAGAGAAFGPWGAVAGAAVGLGTSLAGIFTKQAKAVKAADKTNHLINNINKLIDYTNAYTMRGFDNAFDNVATLLAQNALMNYAAEGATFNIKPDKIHDLDPNLNKTRFEPILYELNRTNDKSHSLYSDGGYEASLEEIDDLIRRGYIIERV